MVRQISLDSEGKEKFRHILNAIPLNMYIPPIPFNLPSPEIAAAIISGEMISIDLKSAYFQKALAFADMARICFRIWQNGEWQYYCYNTLPFGVAPAPRYFQGFFGIVGKFLSSFGVVLIYLDDLLLEIPEQIRGKPQEIRNYIDFVLKLLSHLGLRINRKSCIQPTIEITWLGERLNSHFGQVFPTNEKISRHMNEVYNLLVRNKASPMQVASLRGKLQFLTGNKFKYAFRQIDQFFSDIMSHWHTLDPKHLKKEAKKIFEKKILLPTEFWYVLLQFQTLLLRLQKPQIQAEEAETLRFFSDASELAGGFY